MYILDTDVTACSMRLSDSELRLQTVTLHSMLVALCYEYSLFDTVTKATASNLSQLSYSSTVREALREDTRAIAGTHELPVVGANFQPPACLCCGRHSLQAWGILRRTPLFKWASTYGAMWVASHLQACLRELEWRKGENFHPRWWRTSYLLSGYVQQLPAQPDIPSTWVGASGERLSSDEVVSHYQARQCAAPDNELVWTGTRPPKYLQANRQWYCVPREGEQPLYYCHWVGLTRQDTLCYTSYWLDRLGCREAHQDLTV